MNIAAMEATALELVAPGKGILAADESGPTIEKRFKSIGIASTEETRRAYRETLLTAPGLGAFISGVILYDETLRQKTASGASFLDTLAREGIIPGIKVDKGAKPLPNFDGDKITEGLDGLRERLAEYARLGARFTKWRAVIAVGENRPSRAGAIANAHALGRFAALSQEAGLVPIVEPEVLMDGPHALARHHEVTELMLHLVFAGLFVKGVGLVAMVLMAILVVWGSTSPQQASVSDVAEATIACMRHTVPPAVPGIVFLSGGQSDVRATEHLDAMNRIGDLPWELSFSYGRALQAPALEQWAGKPENVGAAQQALLLRASCNSAARFGRYSSEMERKSG
jgi:fructose-bisphosphate aldolase, class I